MSQNIRLKRSAVPGRVPTTDQLELGELALNTYDGKLYLKQDVVGTQTVIAVGSSADFATSASHAVFSDSALSASYAITSSYASTASYVAAAGTSISASYAATASSADDFTVRGTLTAQKIVVQTITSSINFVTGSTRFGTKLTDTHQNTGSVFITGSLSINGVDYEITSASFDQRILNNSASIDLLSGSYLASSASFDQRILNNSASIDLLSGSYIALSGSYLALSSSYLASSASFDTRILNNSASIASLSGSYLASSASFNTRILNNSASIASLSGSYLNSSASFDTRILNNSASIALLSGSYLAASASFSSSIGQLLDFSASLDITYVTELELAAATASLSGSIAYLSSSYLASSTSFDTRILNNSGSIALLSGSYLASSASFDARILNNSGSIALLSGSYLASSASFDTRILNNSASISSLSGSYLASSASFDTRILNNSASIASLSGSYLDSSASFDTRILNNSGSIALLSGSYLVSSASFDTRVLNNSASISLLSGSYLASSASFNTRILNNSGSISLLSGSYLNTSASFANNINNNSASIAQLSSSFISFSGSYNTGSFTGSFIGALTGTASYASQANSSSYAVTASYANNATTASYSLTASFAPGAGSSVSASYAATASSADDFTVRGTLTAQTIVAQLITSSIEYVTGSTINGSLLTNTHQFTGSVDITGSLAVNGSNVILTNQTSSMSVLTASYANNSTSASYATTASYVLNAISASYATQALSASYWSGSILNATSASYATTASSAPDYLPLAGGTLTGDLYAAGRTFWYQDLILGYGTTGGKITTDGTKYISIMPDYNVESARFWPNGNVTIQNAGTYVDNGFRLDVSGSGRFTDGLTVTGSLQAINGITGSLLGTASYANQALSASYWSGSIINAATASYVLQAISASYATNALSASYWSGSIENAATASYVLQAVSSSYATQALSASYWSGSITNAATASYVLQAVSSSFATNALSASYWSGSILNATSASYAVTSSYSLQSLSASLAQLAISASYATTASYALNGGTGGGGISAIYIADEGNVQGTASYFDFNGAGVSATISNGTASITIPGGGGGGDTNSANAILNQTVSATTWSFDHNLGTLYPVFTIYDANDDVIIPQRIHTVNTASALIYFSSARTGTAVASKGGNVVTASLATSASYALRATSASYAATATSASYAATATSALNALTASYINPLRQTVQITGSLLVSGSTTQVGNNTLSGNTVLSGSIIISGSVGAKADINLGGVLRLDPATDPGTSNLTASFLFTSASNTDTGFDLYYRQKDNVVKFKWLEGGISSGLLYGGVVTASGSTIYITKGSGIINTLNASTGSEVGPIFKYITWNDYTGSATYLTSSQHTFLYVDDTNIVRQQPTYFIESQYQQAIPLGRVTHANYTSITGVGSNVQTTYDSDQQQNEFIRSFGPMKVNGLTVTGQSGSLRFSVGEGTSFNLGGFYPQNPNFPSQYTSTAAATASIARAYRSGSTIYLDNNGGSFYTVIDPTKYDDGSGVLQNTGAGNWTIQRVFFNPVSKRTTVYYGQNRYTTLINALQYLATDSFTEGEFTAKSLVFVGYLVLKGNTSDLTDNENQIIQSGLFRNTAGGSSSSGAIPINLDDLGDVNISSPSQHQALIYDSGVWTNGTPASSSTAVSASYAINATSASYALTASYASNVPVTASYALNANTASFALTASYISGSGGGVGFPFSGSAVITGSLFVSQSFVDFTQATYVTGSFTGSFLGTGSYATFALSASNAPGFTTSKTQSIADVTWSFVHNLNTRNPLLQVYDSNYNQIIPNAIVANDALTATIYFDYSASGYAVASNGGGLYVTGSTSRLDQTSAAVTWSFTHNLNTKYPAFEVYDSNDFVVIPSGIRVINENSAELYFAAPSTGKAIANFSGINGAPNATTASYSVTSEWNGLNAKPISSSLGTAAATSTTVVAQVATASYSAAFFDYAVISGSNSRAGTVMSVWNGGTIEYTDTSTSDIGNTDQVTMSVDLSGANVRLKSTTTDAWTVKTLIRLI